MQCELSGPHASTVPQTRSSTLKPSMPENPNSAILQVGIESTTVV